MGVGGGLIQCFSCALVAVSLCTRRVTKVVALNVKDGEESGPGRRSE